MKRKKTPQKLAIDPGGRKENEVPRMVSAHLALRFSSPEPAFCGEGRYLSTKEPGKGDGIQSLEQDPARQGGWIRKSLKTFHLS
jgi:hypothetical protein